MSCNRFASFASPRFVTPWLALVLVFGVGGVGVRLLRSRPWT